MRERLKKVRHRGPAWNSTEIIPEGDIQPLSKLTLYWRDPLECLSFIHALPTVGKDAEFRPTAPFTDQTKEERVFKDFNSGTWLEEEQVSCLISYA